MNGFLVPIYCEKNCVALASFYGLLQLDTGKAPFSAMSSNSFNIICIFFSFKAIGELICARQNRFIARCIIHRKVFMWLNMEKILLVMKIHDTVVLAIAA